ncbi:hypothetical protein LPJ74_004596 [Coemansia sp. RSA 1843]|nr:hypothetical protein LPJ74_004596 [Coemansia sp. RSA 1843]
MTLVALRVVGRLACRHGLPLKQNPEAIQLLLNHRYLRADKTKQILPRVDRDAHRPFSTQTTLCEQQDKDGRTPGSSSSSSSRETKDNKDTEDEWNRSVKEAVEKAKHEIEKESKSAKENLKKENKDKEEDYLTTLGKVMMELPTQLENFFESGLTSSIYSDKVIFSEPTHSGVNISGKNQYIGVSKVLRIAMNTYFLHPSLTIVSMRQIPITGDDCSGDSPDGGQLDKDKQLEIPNNKSYDVFVRWVFEGLPRHTEIIGGHESRYEGEFRYRVDPKSGLIALHEVTSIHPTPPTAFLAKTGLARWAGWLSPRGSLSLSKEARLFTSRCTSHIARCTSPLQQKKK